MQFRFFPVAQFNMTIKCSYGKQIWNMGSHHGMSSDSEHELNPDIAIDSSYCREVKKNKKTCEGQNHSIYRHALP